MVTWRALIGAAVVLGTMTANAANPQPGDTPVDTAKAMLDRMDRNVDGKISPEEYRNAMVRRFGARDRNDDGVLDGDEQHLRPPVESVANPEVSVLGHGVE